MKKLSSIAKLNSQTLLITGGTGSFGNAVLQRFLHTAHFREIRIFSRDEKKQHDMRIRLANPKVKFYIGDVRDAESIEPAMRGVDYVFHAAALKQVPSCEFFPLEATKTNVLGTQHVITKAIAHGVKKVICLSTDKAAYPINAMGISKALMEKVAVAASRDAGKTVICLTRYGNVIASRGSVIPLFVEQIQAGGPITITDPNMTRFLMSLEEAVELVLFAFEHGRSGDLFVNKAPASTIGNLAQAVLQLCKARCGTQVIGTRHGEKLYETLCTREEMLRAEDMDAFFRIPADNRNLNYSQYYSVGVKEVSRLDDYHSHNTRQLNVGEIVTLLRKLPHIRQAVLGQKVQGHVISA
jgi:UDP-N-acetylglucosamine 4,6-dehydratase